MGEENYIDPFEDNIMKEMREDTYHHLVDSIHYVEHFVFCDVSIIVHIIESEGPWNKEINLLFTAV